MYFTTLDAQEHLPVNTHIISDKAAFGLEHNMKTYFLVPHFDCHPDGPLVLGSVLSDPLDPEGSLTVPLPIAESEIRMSTQTNVEERLRRHRALGGGVFLRFLEWTGIGVSGSSDKSHDRLANFAKLETRTFKPSDDYVRQSIEAPQIQRYLTSHWVTKPVYMVTSVKIAYGASVRESVGRGKGGKGFVGIDGNLVGGVPAAVGASMQGLSEDGRAIEFKESTPFVFAYGLRQIRYSKGAYSDRPFRNGALHGVRDDQDDKTKDGGEPAGAGEAVVFIELDEDDVTGEDIGKDALRVDDMGSGDENDDNDDMDCELIMPSTREKA